MNISCIRRKSENLIIRKRLPSYLKKEEIRLTKVDGNSFKKNVKYHQIPQYVQDIKKFTNKYYLYDDENKINANRVIYINNLFNVVFKNKKHLTADSIYELYRCLYKLNYFNITIIVNLFSILVNNTLDFSNITGYVRCDFTHLLKIANYLFHFQSVCNKRIQHILTEQGGKGEGKEERKGEGKGKGKREEEGEGEGNKWGLKIVDTYLKECDKNRRPYLEQTLFKYVWKCNSYENINILLYSLLIGKAEKTGEIKGKVTEWEKQEQERIELTEQTDEQRETPQEKEILKTYKQQKNVKKELLLEQMNAINKLTSMFDFLLHKICVYFNENTNAFSFAHLKLLFFYLGVFQKCDVAIIEKISNKLVEEIEKKKTNTKLLIDEEQETQEEQSETSKNHYGSKNIRKRGNQKLGNTYNKIDSKEFLLFPYTIGIYMNSYFNNYLIEYVNIYILSLINSRINCDVIHFMYCLIGYKHIMIYFFIIYNLILFKERCQKNRNLLKKYDHFIKRLKTQAQYNFPFTEFAVSNVSPQANYKTDRPLENKNDMYSSEDKRTNFQMDLKRDENKNSTKMIAVEDESIKETDTITQNKEVEFVFELLLKEFQLNIKNIQLIDFRKNCLHPKYESHDVKKFYLYYKNMCTKVYNYCIFLLNKYKMTQMLEMYKQQQSIFLNDPIIKNVYIEVLYEKILFNPTSDDRSRILYFLEKQKLQRIQNLSSNKYVNKQTNKQTNKRTNIYK